MPEDSQLLVTHMFRRSVMDLYNMATAPVMLAKFMVWSMLEETWRADGGDVADHADRPGSVGERGPSHWRKRVLRALSAAYGLDGAPAEPLIAVRENRLPPPIAHPRPSSHEIIKH
eukprot:4532448-Alexandrium_andersonii.AAC.1